jgi:protein gp37
MWPFPNVWLGVSVENQHWADIRIPALLGTPAAVRFLSCEPLLGPVCLEMLIWAPKGLENFPGTHNALTGEWWPAVGDPAEEYEGRITDLPRIDWVIVGGESGPRARPMHPNWARSLRDQCTAAGVPFFFKQWGEWAPTGYIGLGRPQPGRMFVGPPQGEHREGEEIARVGKKTAGRELDGRTWDEFPVGVGA